MHYALWTVNYELWIMNYELWTMNYELWIMNYELWTLNSPPQSPLSSLLPHSTLHTPHSTMNYELWIPTKNPHQLMRIFVGVLGLEPRMTGPESVVLPLHHTPKWIAKTELFPFCGCKGSSFFWTDKRFCDFFIENCKIPHCIVVGDFISTTRQITKLG